MELGTSASELETSVFGISPWEKTAPAPLFKTGTRIFDPKVRGLGELKRG
ncbi:hypothetical protein COO91_03797 [Nostoc flagelliforme CCNUN1]|uniref:Uncharacterized protein n=1 Tax=Nostoc flagelliforme CCNUN1 TaxID=2038116 RepID=A0A2K8SSS8_9NOSO|nr:hypothetical protein COO91_03797 [Nostoc flagelliforme CCNUN1]